MMPSACVLMADWILLGVEGSFTSREIQIPPREVIWGFWADAVVGLRAVARTLWPAFRAAMAREAPRPEEEPVISHVCCLWVIFLVWIWGGGCGVEG